MTQPLQKILFVDDDKDILLIAEYSLKSLDNVTVKFLNSGEAAVQEAIQFQPDLILLDVMMPVMDGIATFKALHLLPNLSNTPIAFITARAQKDDIIEYFKLGVVDVIVKPFDPLTLAYQIQNVWEKCQKKE